MGHFSVEIYAPPGSDLSGNQHCVYLHAFETGSELRAGLGRRTTYYNMYRPHSGLAGSTPVEAYRRIGQSDHGGMPPMI